MIFVTGGTGLVGNSVIRELLSRGMPVRALCRPGTSKACFEGLDVQIIDGDLSDSKFLCDAIRGCSNVIHCAAMIHVGWTRLDEARKVNVEGTRRIIEACLVNDAKLIYVSTVDTLLTATSVDTPVDEESSHGITNTPCSYVVSKIEAEQWVRESIRDAGLKAVIIQPGFMLGPYDWKPSSGRMMLEVARAPIAFAPAGGCSLCDARDVALGIIAAIDKGRLGHAYILAGENVSYRELWSRMSRTAGREKPVYSPRRVMNAVAKFLDLALSILPLREGDINGAAITMGQLFHCYSSGKAREELGYSNRPSQETLDDAWQWLSKNHVRR